MNEAEAEQKLIDHINKPIGYCPLLRSKCRIDCVSFVKASVYFRFKDTYGVQNEYCSSPLITGQIDADCNQ